MKSSYRNRVVERAILIAATQRDMCSCNEEHSKHSSVCRVLEESSNAFSTLLYMSPHVAHVVSRSVTPDWCMVEAAYSPFTLSELRASIAAAMRLARKEIRDDEMGR